MDVFGTVVNVTTLVGQIVIIYRHVAAMQSFGDAAEGVTAKISFEYFRFETWAEQSGYLEIKDRDGLTSEAAQSAQSNTGSHYLLQTAAKAHEIVAQIQNVLAATRLLLEKNQISDKLTDAAGSTSLQPDLSVTQPSIIAKTTARQQFLSLPSSVSSMPAIERATAASSKLKLRLGKETGRLRKLRFSWGLFGEDSDMAKLEDLVQQLRYWNDGLRFGLGRTSDKTSETIDVRQLGSHFDLYQHPELRADAHKRYKKRHDIYSLGLVLFEIGIWQSIFYFKKDNQDAQDFRRTIRNACESHLAHFMGKAYQRAVLQCLDEDDMWKEAEGDDDDDDSSEIHEVFFWKVVRELGGVQ
ncbi:hypothetical protein ACHAP6_009000 [Verticillium nonalfalfae]